jgi:hypothetical protein
MRPVGRPVAAGGRPGIGELAAGRQSYRTAEEGYEACLAPLVEASVVQHCVALRVSRQLIRHRHHLSRQARGH